MNIFSILFFLAWTAISLSTPAHGAPVSIPNSSFEAPVLPPGGVALTTPPGWTGTGSVGYVSNGWNGGAISPTGIHGNQLCWFNTDVGTSVSQILGATFTVGKSYELKVSAVKASNAWSGSTTGNQLTIQLYYGAFNVIASGSALADNLADSQNALTDLIATLGTVQSGDAWAGQQIGIRIISTIDGPNNNDWAFDNVRLEESAPENLTVTNSSFELPVLPNNGAAVGTPTGWTGQGITGYVRNGWNGGAINIPNLHGNQAAWFNTDVGNGLHQNLTNVFETGRTYQLEVGAVKASTAWTGSTVGNQVQIQLYYGNFNVIASSSALAEGMNDSQGALTDIVATLGTVQATDPWAGQQIGIRIISTIDGPNNDDWAIDNVRLTATAGNGQGSVLVSRPVQRQVIQRNSGNTANVPVAGTFTGTPDTIEARLTVMPGQNGNSVGWTVIDPTPTGGTYNSILPNVSAGGWYQLEVRANYQGVFVTSTVPRIGVGDVYLVAGQSNSANYGTPTITSPDDRVSAWNYSSGVWSLASDPMPGADGGGGSTWTRLGPLLAARDAVPIAFGSVGVGGTRVDQWVPGAEHYPRIQTAVRGFPVNGFRALLWHQGEWDAKYATSALDYKTRLQSIITKSRIDAGWNFPWYIAEASYTTLDSNLITEEPVVSGQRATIASTANVFPGPMTDDFHLEGKLQDGVHFNASGLADHAAQWEQVLGGVPPLAPKNGDLESNPALADGAIHVIDTRSNYSPSVMGWRALNATTNAAADGFCGYYNPDNTYYPGTADGGGGTIPGMNGRHVAFISDSSPGAGFLQTRRVLLKGGQTYTFKAALGVRANSDSYGGATLELRAGDTVLVSRVVNLTDLNALHGGNAAGTFSSLELKYTSPTVVTDAKPLSIRITKNQAGAGTYVDFDAVALEVAVTPFASWQIDNWGNVAHPDAGWNLNPDGDAFPNGIEFHLGLDPKVKNVNPLTGPASHDGRTWMGFSVPLNPNINHDGLRLRYSFDLKSWTDAATLPGGTVIVTKLADLWSIEVSVTDHPKTFFQISATQGPLN